MIGQAVEIRLTIFPATWIKLYTDLLLYSGGFSVVLGAALAPPQYPPPSLEAGTKRQQATPAEAACPDEGAEPLRAERSPDEV